MLGPLHIAQHRLQIERRLGRVAVGGAIDPMLPHQNQCVGQHVQSHGQPPALRPHHELIVFQCVALFLEYAHVLPLSALYQQMRR